MTTDGLQLRRGASGLSERLGSMRPARQYASNPTAWISHITNIAWDQMDVDMHARLTSGPSDVDANVVSVGPMLVLDYMMCPIQETKYSGLLLGCHVKETCDMALWDDKYVSAAQ
jgi:hypothetical protein